MSQPPPAGYIVLMRCVERPGAYEPVDFGHNDDPSEVQPLILLRRGHAAIFTTREAADLAIEKTMRRGRESGAAWARPGIRRPWMIIPCYHRD